MQCQRTLRNAITDVEAKPDPELTNLGPLHHRQETSQFPRADQEIIRPLDPHWQSTGFKPFRDRNRYGQSSNRRGPGPTPSMEYGADPEAACRRGQGGPTDKPYLWRVAITARGPGSCGWRWIQPARTFSVLAQTEENADSRTSPRTCRAQQREEGRQHHDCVQWISSGEHH